MQKKLFFLAVALVAMLSLHAQTMTLSELRQEIADMRAELPIKEGAYLSITDIQLNDRGIVWALDIYDVGGIMSDVVIQDWEEEARGKLPGMLQDDFMRRMAQCLADNNMTFTVKYHGTVSGLTRKVVFKPGDLREALRGEGAFTPQQQIQSMVDQTQLMLPIDLGNGMKETGFYLKDGYLTTEITCDARMVNVGAFASQKKAMAKQMEQTFASDPITQEVIKTCVAAGYGYSFIYKSTDTSISPVTIRWTAAQLKAQLK